VDFVFSKTPCLWQIRSF